MIKVTLSITDLFSLAPFACLGNQETRISLIIEAKGKRGTALSITDLFSLAPFACLGNQETRISLIIEAKGKRGTALSIAFIFFPFCLPWKPGNQQTIDNWMKKQESDGVKYRIYFFLSCKQNRERSVIKVTLSITDLFSLAPFACLGNQETRISLIIEAKGKRGTALSIAFIFFPFCLPWKPGNQQTIDNWIKKQERDGVKYRIYLFSCLVNRIERDRW